MADRTIKGDREGVCSDLASDGSLLRRFQDGSQGAAEALYLRYAARLRQLIEANASNDLKRCVEVDDLVQSVFRRFFQRASGGWYDVPGNIDLWNLLLVIALNRVRDRGEFYRAQKRDVRRTCTEDELPCPVGELASNDEAAGMFLRLVVQETLAQLPDSHRQVCELRLAGYEVGEIGIAIGRSPRTVERILQGCRQRLSEIFAPESA